MCVCIHPNGSVRNEAKPVSSFQKSKKGVANPGRIMYHVLLLRLCVS